MTARGKPGKRRIGILARAGDRQAGMVRDAVERLAPGSVRGFDLDLDGGQRATIAEDGVSWDGVRLDRLDALYVHGFAYEDPVLPLAPGQVDWTLWQTSHVLEQQKYSFLFSLLCRLESAGVALYNGPSAHLAGFAGFDLLERLGEGGIQIPEMLCSNDADAVAGFRERHREVVWRTATGRCAWQSFRDKQGKDLIDAAKPPILLARVVPGPLRRAYVFEGRALLCLEGHAPSCEGLERLEAFRRVDHGGVPLEAGAIVDARWSMIQFVSTPDGPVVYGLDPDPVLTELPGELAGPAVEALAEGLLGRGRGRGRRRRRAADGAPAFRDTLFLRRMLRILFEMQRSKYDGS